MRSSMAASQARAGTASRGSELTLAAMTAPRGRESVCGKQRGPARTRAGPCDRRRPADGDRHDHLDLYVTGYSGRSKGRFMEPHRDSSDIKRKTSMRYRGGPVLAPIWRDEKARPWARKGLAVPVLLAWCLAAAACSSSAAG